MVVVVVVVSVCYFHEATFYNQLSHRNSIYIYMLYINIYNYGIHSVWYKQRKLTCKVSFASSFPSASHAAAADVSFMCASTEIEGALCTCPAALPAPRDCSAQSARRKARAWLEWSSAKSLKMYFLGDTQILKEKKVHDVSIDDNRH